VVLACTELPIALAAADRDPPVVCIDTTRVLARATVEHWRANHESQLRKIVHA
jgi:aspartate/glutamate racemase